MENAKPYNLELRSVSDTDDHLLPDPVWEAMWELYVEIGKFWKNVKDPEPMRPSLKVFIENRIELFPWYQLEYENAAAVIALLKREKGKRKAYKFLFTDPQANMTPPLTPLQRARQFVSNEFVALQLSLGGFKVWGAVNFPSYFGGPNIPGQHPPYRTPKDVEE